ncbi:hypothetical protein Lesp02_08830 [Lentzea sp. NBRC 105346]|nr:hypothetical protein Lesp02_08830 [Lentzea sp. NBRC 105346]
MVNVAVELSSLDHRGPAFFCGDRVWTHPEVHEVSARAASVLARRVRPGDHVLMALPDGIGFVVAFLAIARLGAVAVMVNPDLPAADHAYLVSDCAPRMTITTANVTALLEADGPPAQAVDVTPETPLYVQYTSGTTGQPKGAVHCHGDLATYYRSAGPLLGITADDIALSVSRMHFAYGFGNSLVYPLYSGSSAILTPRRPTNLDGFRPTILYSVPSALARMTTPFPVRACVSAGEALLPSVHERASALLGAPIIDGIGSTEVGGFYCMNSVHEQVPGTLGRPVPGYELDVRDGRLWVRGSTVLRRYLNGPAFSGWFATGDRAVAEPDGTYRYLGRDDDMEIVGGITLSPLEVERVLTEHPGVAEVAVAAIPDELGATRLHAFVVPHDGVAAFDQELVALARERLAAFKVPKVIRMVDALPRTPTGKIRRFVVRRGTW